MLLQLVVCLFQAEGRSQKVLRYKFYQILKASETSDFKTICNI